jgi:hypothetical protein
LSQNSNQQDYIAIAQQLRANAERRDTIRRRELILLALFVVGTLFFAIIG